MYLYIRKIKEIVHFLNTSHIIPREFQNLLKRKKMGVAAYRREAGGGALCSCTRAVYFP